MISQKMKNEHILTIEYEYDEVRL